MMASPNNDLDVAKNAATQKEEAAAEEEECKNTNETDRKESEAEEERRKRERERLRRRREMLIRRYAVPLLLVAPWFVGVIWTACHPLLSVVTGELKCRGSYIDENGLDVHRHLVKPYPLARSPPSSDSRKEEKDDDDDDAAVGGGMCDAISSGRLPGISPSVECLRHEATEAIAFDVARILPAMGPVIEGAEAIVLFVGERDASGGDASSSQSSSSRERSGDDGDGERRRGDWYERSDLNASVMEMIRRLGNARDSPWLTKTVFVVSPAERTATTGTASPMPLVSVVDAFVASYAGAGRGGGGGGGGGDEVRSLPPEFTFPALRTVLVLSDVLLGKTDTPPAGVATTDVRLLPQGDGGALPNLDLVFAAHASLQNRAARNGAGTASSSFLHRGNVEVRMHPHDVEWLEELLGRAFRPAGRMMGLSDSTAEGYAKDLAGMAGFVAALAVGPRQPHAPALARGIDALTVELRAPETHRDDDRGDGSPSPDAIHPHRADAVRCVEHLLRSISNLHERLHHSVAQYVMPSPTKFVSHGEYVYPAVLAALPMVVRAATIALRDCERFRFAHVGRAVGAAGAASAFAWAVLRGSSGSGWTARAVFAVSYLLVVMATGRKSASGAAEGGSKRTGDSEERRMSLRFVACLLGVYLHAPLILANYSLGFPSAVFWSPLLAAWTMRPSARDAVSGSRALSIVASAAKCAFLVATSPPAMLVPGIFPTYTPYVLGVYAPLHLLLAALWFT